MTTSSRLLARNTLLNLVGQVVPMVAAVVSIPILIAHLGAARFGVLTLAWAAIGYFGLFDLGLGRALTQAVAARLGQAEGTDDLGEVTWTALWLMLVLGIAGAFVVSACTPWIVERGLNVPPALQRESRTAFYLLALSLPFVVTSSGLRGLLEAHQHFGLGTALRIPLALFTFLGPLAVLPFSSALGPVVGALVVGRLLSWVAYLVACIWRYDFLRQRLRLRRGVVMPLVRYGGWMTVSNIVSPVMAYLDRFVIGAILPLAAVAHYVTPYELVSKLLVLPLAMIAVLFPAFAATFATDRVRTVRLFERAVRVIVLVMFPVLLAIVLFAREGLTLWVGRDFASASTTVLQWLAIGIFVNAVAQAPFAVVQGIGRPDITAKFHLAELPLYLAGMWWLAHHFGIAGVAAAWTARATIDAVALLFAAHRLVPEPEGRLQRTLLGAVGAVGALAAATLVQGAWPKLAYLAAAFTAFGVLGWRRAIHPAERAALLEWTRLGRGRSAPSA
jgi:O-antigen/teichoic acid export membrane protein